MLQLAVHTLAALASALKLLYKTVVAWLGIEQIFFLQHISDKL